MVIWLYGYMVGLAHDSFPINSHSAIQPFNHTAIYNYLLRSDLTTSLWRSSA